MKKIFFAIAVIAAVFSISGCLEHYTPDVSAIPEGYGAVRLSFTQGAAKTAMPNVALDDLRFEYFLWRDSDFYQEQESIEQGEVLLLLPGRYDLTVTAFLKEDTGNIPVAEGGKIIEVAAGVENYITISLVPIAGRGNGTLELTITSDIYPDEVTVILKGLSYREDFIPYKIINADGTPNVFTVSSGYYLLRAALFNADSNTTAVRTEVVHIYQNLTTAASYEFAAREFISGSTDPGGNGFPATPTWVTATAESSTSTITVNWNPVSGANGYRIFFSTTAAGIYTLLAENLVATSYTHTGLTTGTTYYYTVAAYNDIGESAHSASVSATAGGTSIIFTVTFDANGGSGTIPVAQTVPAGSLIAPPYESGLTKTGYIFGGWYMDSAFTSQWNFATDTVNGNVTLYAKWILEELAFELITSDNAFPAGVNIGTYRVSAGTVTSSDVVIPDSYNGFPVTEIGNWAFQNQISLTSITIPNSVTYIGRNAFSGCTGLTKITIPDSVTIIGDQAFNGTSLTSIPIPDSVTSIGEGTFANIAGFISITIPESIMSIGRAAFQECTNLVSVTIPVGVMSIGEDAFNSCSNLTSIIIPATILEIGNYAFAGCNGLTSVTFDGDDIIPENFGDEVFPVAGGNGNILRTVFFAGGAGEYRRSSGGSDWVKQ